MARHRFSVGAAAALIAVLSTPSSALAYSVLYSYEGSDFAYNTSNGVTVYACDRENDGNQVEVQSFRRNTEVRFVKRDSYDAGKQVCTGESVTTPGQTVYKFRIVELKAFDSVGAWVYPA